MNAREFAEIIESEAIYAAVQSTQMKIVSPQRSGDIPESASPREKSAMELINAEVRRWQQQNEWFRSLDRTQRLIFIGLLRECAQHCALGFCSLLDGSFDPGTLDETGEVRPEMRRFKISAAGENCKEIIVDLEKSAELGDALYHLCVEKHGYF